MSAQFDLETRIRGYADEFDREVPTTAMLERRIMARVAITTREEGRRLSLPRELALAGLVLVAVALLAFGVARLRSINPPVTAHPKTSLVNGPGSKAPSGLTVAFVSGTRGWVAEMPPLANQRQPQLGPTVLFATTDAGHHWQRQLSWDGPLPNAMRFSADGLEGLVVGQGGVPIYHTSDGGGHWQRMALPPEVIQGEGGAQVYFLNPREGWVMSYLQEATPGFVGLFHTTDGGAHWTRVARLDVNTVFAYGQRGGTTQGTLLFTDSTTGWLITGGSSGTGITPKPVYFYVTRDGGVTWKVQTISPPAGTSLDSSNAGLSGPLFFNAQDGILGLTAFPQFNTPSAPPQLPQSTYVYRTTDGGLSWSYTASVPGSVLVGFRTAAFIDSAHWVLFDGSRLIRTSDGGQHWSAIAGALPTGTFPETLTFTDQSNGWAVLYQKSAAPPTLYRTTDGGSHWSEVSLPSAT